VAASSCAGLLEIHVSRFHHEGSFAKFRTMPIAQGEGRFFESTWDSAPLGA